MDYELLAKSKKAVSYMPDSIVFVIRIIYPDPFENQCRWELKSEQDNLLHLLVCLYIVD